MSKFWEVGDSSSEESDDEEVEEKVVAAPKPTASFQAFDDSGDEEETRVVVSKVGSFVQFVQPHPLVTLGVALRARTFELEWWVDCMR
jgi:hypothetical protein